MYNTAYIFCTSYRHFLGIFSKLFRKTWGTKFPLYIVEIQILAVCPLIIYHCCLITWTTKSLSRSFPRYPYAYFIPFLFHRGVNDSCRRFRTTPGPVANVNSRGCNVNLDRIARGVFPSALYSSWDHDNCRRVTVSSAALGQLVRSRFRVYSKRDERKGEKERVGVQGNRRWPIVEPESAFSFNPPCRHWLSFGSCRRRENEQRLIRLTE